MYAWKKNVFLDGEFLLEIKGDGACDLCFGLRLVSVRVLQ